MNTLSKGEYIEIEIKKIGIEDHTIVRSIQLFTRNCSIDEFIASQLKEDELLISYEVRPIYYKDTRS